MTIRAALATALFPLVMLTGGCSAQLGVDRDPTALGTNPPTSDPRSTEGCPDATDPAVHYIDTEPSACAASLFQCEAGEVRFDDRCGCGCIGATPSTNPVPGDCPDPASPSVHYIGDSATDPSYCLAAFFQCEPSQTTFNDACGCGCID